MADKPVIFSAPMIKALLAGTKTQTRRVLKPQPDPSWQTPVVSRLGIVGWTDADGRAVDRKLPIAPGDRLWVKETWRVRSEFNQLSPTKIGVDEGAKSAIGVWYEADDNKGTLIELGRTRSPIHMPRWASRLTLIVTDVRVQRLQEITYPETRAEGVETTDIWQRRQAACLERNEECGSVCRDSFRELWNSIHGPDAWSLNPWVACYSFTVHRCNIDQMDT